VTKERKTFVSWKVLKLLIRCYTHIIINRLFKVRENFGELTFMGNIKNKHGRHAYEN